MPHFIVVVETKRYDYYRAEAADRKEAIAKVKEGEAEWIADAGDNESDAARHGRGGLQSL